MKINQLPPSEREAFEAFAQNCPMGKYSIARRGDGYDSSHTQLMWDAWQASAQVQGEPFGYIHHFAAHDESGALIDTTWEADGCADPLPHPTFPSMWKWAHCTPFYTTQQPTQATQAEVTDAQIKMLIPCGDAWKYEVGFPEAIQFARAILALRPERVQMTPASRDVIMATRTANADADEWPEPWAYQRGWNDAEAHHRITAQEGTNGEIN